MEYSEEEIELEVQARVKFKLSELMTVIENSAKSHWHLAFINNSQKHSHYFEALNQVKSMMEKEINMPTPVSDMQFEKLRNQRDIVVNKIMDRFCRRGEKDYYDKERVLVSIIEKLQNENIK